MKIRDIDTFFKDLDKRIDFPIQVILTGGAAAIVQGVERVTKDIDFEIRLLDPALWAIGKLTRFLTTDINDLIVILKKSKLNPSATARLWGKALGLSPISSAQNRFSRQVEYFFDRYGKSIWGVNIKPEGLKRIFLSSARQAARTSYRLSPV